MSATKPQGLSSTLYKPNALATPSPIEVLVRARYPLLFVVTWEEERALNQLFTIAEALNKKLYNWTIVQGLARYRPGTDGNIEGRKGTKDPLVALREVVTMQEPAVYVFQDFHNFIMDSSVKRTLRDLATALRSSLSTVILLSPVLKIPDELEKDVTIVDFPLPGREELEHLVEQISHDIAQNPSLAVDMSAESREAIINAAVGLTLNEAENVFAKTLVTAQKLDASQAPNIYSEKKQIIRKSGLLEYIDVEETLQGVGGLDSLKSWIGRRRGAMDPKARAFGLPPPKGLLLVGVQGCGKSLAAKATANELKYPLLRMDVGRLFSKMVGETEFNIRRALMIAEAVAPVVLWIDEIEKGLSGVKSSGSSDAGTTSRVFGTIITWLQEKKSPVFVMATANDIEELPPEILRKGRFDEIFFVDLPSEPERRDIFAIHLGRRGRDPKTFDLDYLAKCSEGYSGAEIEQAIIEALFNAYGAKPDIETIDVVNAVKRQVPLSQTMRNSIHARRMWAIGRTVNASSSSDLVESLERVSSDDDGKEAMYLDYIRRARDVPESVRYEAERYLGGFPEKSADAEKMKIYLKDFSRLAEKIAHGQIPPAR
ncbi:MAG: AAA family ATPase [Candidatus Sumerlaeaceae bacterium]|nr:AAA family ATPase [Candidatus Sumerlaeaceae bacterium]